MGKPEEAVEQYLRNQCINKRWLCWKFTSPNLRGVPDRIVIADGVVAFVECKSPTGKVRAQQLLRLKELNDRHIPNYVASTRDEVDSIIKDIEARAHAKEKEPD